MFGVLEVKRSALDGYSVLTPDDQLNKIIYENHVLQVYCENPDVLTAVEVMQKSGSIEIK